MKRIRIEVCFRKGDSRSIAAWRVKRTGSDLAIFCHTQSAGIERAREWAYGLVKAGKAVTLKIKRKDGTIREERTYPRSSDPRRTKG